jgi:hypothetical protein
MVPVVRVLVLAVLVMEVVWSVGIGRCHPQCTALGLK